MAKVRVGVVGLGANGSEYVRLYAKHPNAALLAVCDLDEGRRKALSGEYSVPHSSRDFADLVRMPEIDAVSIHTADRFHCPIAIAALQAGKHVYTEKPMGATIEGCRRVIELSRETGLKVMVGQVLRFNPFFRRIKEMVDAGVLGDIYYAEGYYMSPHWVSPKGQDRERDTYEIAFVCSGTHPFDLLRWYIGEPEEVQAFGNRGMACPDVAKDDFVCAIYRFDTGCVVKIAATWGSTCEFTNRISLFGSKGSIVDGKIALRDESAELRDLPFARDRAHPFDPEVDAFLDCIIADRPPPIDARDGGNTAIGILSAIDALHAKRAVKVPVVR